jgi:hypothetical protein
MALQPGMDPAAAYRQRFETSVLGQHAMMPECPKFGDSLIVSTRADGKVPHPCPSGPDTNFMNKTAMPHRFTADCIPDAQRKHKEVVRAADHPIYSTTASEIGRLPCSNADLHMRWYGLRGEFTDKFYLGGANPKGNVNSGLNTAMDRSGVHHSHDQGWGGNQGLKHHNIGSLSSARALQRGR